MVVKVFTRQLGLRSYLVKGVRGPRGRIKQNMLQPLSCVDMVVYDNPKHDLNHIKELSSRQPAPSPDAVGNALRFFKAEVLFRTLREQEPMPDLWDYVAADASCEGSEVSNVPIRFLITVVHHLGVEPLDNYGAREPLFDLQQGRYVSEPSDTTLTAPLSLLMHKYLSSSGPIVPQPSADDRRIVLDALITYCRLHLGGLGNFNSHEILHTILK